jgi:hypothetical protein
VISLNLIIFEVTSTKESGAFLKSAKLMKINHRIAFLSPSEKLSAAAQTTAVSNFARFYGNAHARAGKRFHRMFHETKKNSHYSTPPPKVVCKSARILRLRMMANFAQSKVSRVKLGQSNISDGHRRLPKMLTTVLTSLATPTRRDE